MAKECADLPVAASFPFTVHSIGQLYESLAALRPEAR
jgi:hypothetical protein